MAKRHRRKWRVAFICVVLVLRCARAIRVATFLTLSEKEAVKDAFDRYGGIRTAKESIGLFAELGIITTEDVVKSQLDRVGHVEGAMLRFHQLKRILQYFKREHLRRSAVSDIQEVFNALCDGTGLLPQSRLREAAREFALLIDVDAAAASLSVPVGGDLTLQDFAALINASAHQQHQHHSPSFSGSAGGTGASAHHYHRLSAALGDVAVSDADSLSNSMVARGSDPDMQLESSESIATMLTTGMHNRKRAVGIGVDDSDDLIPGSGAAGGLLGGGGAGGRSFFGDINATGAKSRKSFHHRRDFTAELLNLRDSVAALQLPEPQYILRLRSPDGRRISTSSRKARRLAGGDGAATDEKLNAAIYNKLFPRKVHGVPYSVTEVRGIIDDVEQYPFDWCDGRRAPRATVSFAGASHLPRVAQRELVNLSGGSGEHKNSAPNSRAGSPQHPQRAPSRSHTPHRQDDVTRPIVSREPPVWRQPKPFPVLRNRYTHVKKTKLSDLAHSPSFTLPDLDRAILRAKYTYSPATQARRGPPFLIPSVQSAAIEALTKMARAPSPRRVFTTHQSHVPSDASIPSNVGQVQRRAEAVALPAPSQRVGLLPGIDVFDSVSNSIAHSPVAGGGARAFPRASQLLQPSHSGVPFAMGAPQPSSQVAARESQLLPMLRDADTSLVSPTAVADASSSMGQRGFVASTGVGGGLQRPPSSTFRSRSDDALVRLPRPSEGIFSPTVASREAAAVHGQMGARQRAASSMAAPLPVPMEAL